MKKKTTRSILETLTLILKTFKTEGKRPKYRLLSIEKNADGDFTASVHMVNSRQVFHMKPEEILSDDELTDSLQMMGVFLQAGVLLSENTKAYSQFQWAIISKKIGVQKRPSEPRRVKRRPKTFARLQTLLAMASSE